jgi:topoisomerase-4 subunit B
MADLFGGPGDKRAAEAYSAKDIEVLEGLEPVRRRPGMYIGGTDEAALHHLAAEILDNAMDEAVAGHASFIDFALAEGNVLTVRDNGRGIPVDPHPKFKDRSALEVIFTTLHSGGKFSGKAYETSGGLHGVGSSVVNALSESMEVDVWRDRTQYKQKFARGVPVTKLMKGTQVHNRRGTSIAFKPDPQIFGPLQFSPLRLYRLCRSKAYLFRGVEIRWSCAPALLKPGGDVPEDAVLHFPGGLRDSLAADIGDAARAIPEIWDGDAKLPDSPAGKRRGVPEFLHQYGADAAGRHA